MTHDERKHFYAIKSAQSEDKHVQGILRLKTYKIFKNV